MILLADSGSTKTDWVIIETKNEIRSLKTQGLNPFFETTESVYEKLKEKFFDKEKQNIQEIYFYGAGCVKGKNSHIIEDALLQIFPNAKIEAEDDMLGAAKALFGNESGIACILGTGANSCKYENGHVVDKVPTLGYILGDEGSGAYLGKKLVNAYFKRKLPKRLEAAFKKQFKPELIEIQNAVYKQKNPNRFLASFAPFLKENIEHGYVKKFMQESFEDFFESNIMQYPHYEKYRIGFIGSIAHHFSDTLKMVAESKCLKISCILSKPIDALIEFHSN